MNEMKRVLALVLCAVMLVGVMPVGALAAEAETTAPSEALEIQAAEAAAAAATTEAAEIETSVPETTGSEAEEAAYYEAEAEAAFSATGTDYLFVATDRHTNTSIIGNIINNMEENIEDQLDYLALGGDMVGSGNSHPTYSSSTVLAEVTGAASYMSAANVDIVAGIHDMNVTDDAGIVLPYQGGCAQIFEGDRYYVYGVEEYCISEDSNESNWSAQAQKFVDWANGDKIDTSKAIIVVSHYPLHAKRDDNDGAYIWHTALNKVATNGGSTVVRDIVFFHGHNHTVDSKEYVYNVGDTMSIQNGSDTTSEAIQYTYATAGYLKQNSNATLVTITDETISLDKYGTSGSGSSMATVTRVVQAESEAYVTAIAITTEPTKTEYYLGETLDTTGMVVTATYSDGTTAEITPTSVTGYDMSTAGTQKVSVNYYDNGITFSDTFEITVTELAEDAVLTGITVNADAAKTEYWEGDKLLLDGLVVTAAFSTGDTVDLQYKEFSTSELYGGYELDNFNMNDGLTTGKTQTVTVTYTYGEVTCTASYVINVWTPVVSDSTSGISVAVTEDYGVASVAVKESENTNVAAAIAAVIDGDNYVAWDISLTFDEGYTVTTADKTVTLPIPEGVENPVVYYVSDDGLTVTDMKAEDNGDGTVSFVTDHFSTYVLGDGTTIETESGDATQPGTEDVTTTQKVATEVTIYKLVATPESGKTYLIVNSATGTGYGLDGDTTGYAVSSLTSAGDYYSSWDEDAQSGTAFTISSDDVYIEANSNAYLWTAGSNAFNIGYSSSSSNSLGSTTYTYTLAPSGGTSGSWSIANNQLSISLVTTDSWFGSDTNSTYYLSGGSTWSMSNTAANVYFYEPVTVYTVSEESVTVPGEPATTYSTVGTDITDAPAMANQTVDLSSVLYSTPEGGTASDITASSGLTPVYTVVTDKGNPAVIAQNEDGTYKIDGSTATLSGVVGTAVLKVTYTSGDLVAWDEFIVTTTAPTYTINLHESVVNTDADGKVTVTCGDEITETVVLKNKNAGDTYSVWAVIKANGIDIGDVDDDRIKWTISNVDTNSGTDESIAIVDPTTGIIMFTGDAYGTFNLTATYLDENGDPLCEDTITISVSENAGVVPGDGTNDFPAYPNEGAVRINKTAEAVGNFSETGIAKVELSMTGVPYTTGNEMDVVVMLDMTGSMSTDGMEAAEEATKAFVEKIVKNEDGTYNSNRVAVYAFNSGSSSPYELVSLKSITSDAELTTANTAIDTASDKKASGGTPFDEAAKKCYDVLQAAKTDGIGDDRQQFCVFMSDGGPTAYRATYDNTNGYLDISNSGSGTSAITTYLTGYSSSDTSTWEFTLPSEYYTDLMKEDDVTVYTVGLLLQNVPSNPSPYSSMSDVSSVYDSTTDKLTTEGNHYWFTSRILKQMATDESKYIDIFSVDTVDNAVAKFTAIAQQILEAATNVKVTDEIGEKYTLNFSFPDGVTTEHTDDVTEFYIQVVEYTLDADHERDGDPAVLENFTFKADGTLKSHTVDGTVCSDCAHVTTTDGVITKIDGTYFDYERTGDTEFLYWNSDKLTNKELALQYFAHLDDSTGTAVADQIAAGSYYTNEEATVTYTNFQGTECELTFPKPQMTWNGAQVTYKFYLVNSNGEPVNRAGKVVPFTEAVWVSEDYTHAVTWNDLEGNDKVFAQEVAALAEVPGVYTLYDSAASYEVRVYQTESVDTNGTNFNYFRISGSEANGASGSTTKVYNTLAGTKYSKYGVYSHMDVDTDVGNGYTVQYKTTDIDYANTTVAFAVLWTPTLVEDTIIVDYGLDVEVDVSINDMVETKLVGVRDDQPYDGNDPVAINTGVIPSAKVAGTDTASITIGDDNRTIGTAEILNNTFIKFSLDKPTESAASNAMLFNEPAVIYYESQYHWLNSTTNSYQDDIMYSSLTVIPASTVYYEDEYVTLKTFTAQKDDEGNIVRDDEGKIVYSETPGWDTNSKAATSTQAVDRPGTTANMENVEDWDANNNYGYDDAYGNCATYSMDNAAMINVTKEKYGTASFDFYGTGFDVISSTSSDTGTLVVTVTHVENGETVTDRNLVVNTYYGYKLTNQYMFYVYTKDGWIYKGHSYDLGFAKKVDTLPEDVEISNQLYAIYGPFWVPAADGTDGLFQIPVMKVTDLPYGKYSVTITAGYNRMLDIPGDGNYDLYLDAIRIYDPTGVVSGKTNNTTVSNAYKADGEGWAKYSELRDIILAAGTFGEGIDSAAGAVFIDHDPTGTNLITDYAAYGPNNELYLTNGQTVAFILDPSLQYSSYDLADVQIGLKSADKALGEVYATLTTYTESNGTYTSNSSTAPIEPIAAGTTATDRYYSIGTHVNKTGETILSIQNTGSGILSITNIKLTFNAPPVEKEDGISLFAMTRSVADGILLAMNTADNAVEEPEEVPDAELNVSLNKQSVKVGGSVQVKVTTSADVDALSVNGQEITRFKQNNKTGKRTWTVKVTAEEAGDLNIEVIAYSADGKTLDSVVETVEVTAKKSGNVNKTVGQLLGKLFG